MSLTSRQVSVANDLVLKYRKFLGLALQCMLGSVSFLFIKPQILFCGDWFLFQIFFIVWYFYIQFTIIYYQQMWVRRCSKLCPTSQRVYVIHYKCGWIRFSPPTPPWYPSTMCLTCCASTCRLSTRYSIKHHLCTINDHWLEIQFI